MKKFLKLSLPLSSREVPPETDAVILAAAAMRAQAFRRKRIALKLAIPGIAAAAAAVSVTAITIFPEIAGHPHSAPAYHAVETAAVKPQIEKSIPAAPAELLALADTTDLEQESYNLATMTDFNLDGDNFII